MTDSSVTQQKEEPKCRLAPGGDLVCDKVAIAKDVFAKDVLTYGVALHLEDGLIVPILYQM